MKLPNNLIKIEYNCENFPNNVFISLGKLYFLAICKTCENFKHFKQERYGIVDQNQAAKTCFVTGTQKIVFERL